MACNFCKSDLYIKTVQYTKPLLAPLTRAEELRQELSDLTGEVYLQIPNFQRGSQNEPLLKST